MRLNKYKYENKEWLLGLYIRAYLFKNNILPDTKIRNACSDQVQLWDKQLCTEYFASWCKRDLIDFAEYIGLRGRKPVILHIKDIFRIVIIGLLKVTSYLTTTIVKNEILWSYGIKCLLLSMDVTKVTCIRFKDLCYSVGTVVYEKSSSINLKVLLKELGVLGVLYFKFSRESLIWMLATTIQYTYAISETMLEWIETAASEDNRTLLKTILTRAAERTVDLISENAALLILQVWNMFVVIINQILQTGKIIVEELKKVSECLKEAILKAKEWMHESVAPIANELIHRDFQYLSEITVFSAKQLWNISRMLVVSGVDIAGLCSTAIQRRIFQNEENLVGLIEILIKISKHIGNIAVWTWDQKVVKTLVLQYMKGVVISEAISGLITNTNILALVLMDMVHYSIAVANSVMTTVYNQLFIGLTSIPTEVLYATAGLSVVLSLYSLSDYLRVVVEYMKQTGKKVWCVLKEVMWYCLDVNKWSEDNAEQFKIEMRKIIVELAQQGIGKDAEIIANEFDAAMNPYQYRDLYDIAGDYKYATFYDESVVNKIKKINFDIPSVIEGMSVYLRQCQPLDEDTEENECFHEKEMERERRYRVLTDCVRLYKDLNIIDKNAFNMYVLKNHPDKTREKESEIFQAVMGCSDLKKYIFQELRTP